MTDKTEEGSSCLPVRFWGLNPLFWSHMKMFVKKVRSLEEYSDYKVRTEWASLTIKQYDQRGERGKTTCIFKDNSEHMLGVYCYSRNHPVVRVEILGYVVSVDIREKLTTYGVDDGSGTIACCCWHSSDPNEDRRQSYNLGQLVTVQGKISVFREQRQLTVDQIYPESDLNAEVLFWLEAVNLGNTVYKQPFNPSLKDFQAGNGGASKKEELKKAIVMHLMENKMVAFQFTTLCLEPDIQQLAREAVKEKCTNQEEAKKIDRAYEAKKVIRQSVKDLERDGLVYFKDSGKDLYEVISHEHNLGPAILKAIKKISEPSSSSASKWAIMDVLHSSHKFHHVTVQQVEHSLDRLLQSSDVYRQSEHQYCLVSN